MVKKKGFSAPCIYHKDLAKGYCILEDFGTTNLVLFKVLK